MPAYNSSGTILFSDKSRVIVQSTIMLMLGGSGGIPLRQNVCFEIEFGDICESKCELILNVMLI